MAGSLLFLLSLIPFEILKPYADTIPRDGELEFFTSEIHVQLSFLKWVGAVFMGFSGWMVISRNVSQRLVSQLVHGVKDVAHAIIADIKALCKDLFWAEDDRWHRYILLAVFVGVIVNSARFLQRPILYDEAYTFNIFASRPLLRIISDYHLPNNHIFHSILVHIIYRIFGNQLWVVRLPAFMAGIFLVPAGYLAARRIFDPDTALLSAGLIGLAPILINYSTNARGYSILCLVTLVIIALGAYVQKIPNKAAWVLMVVFSVFGFYTVPTMLFPFGAFCIWMALVWLLNDTQPVRENRFLRNLIGMVIITVVWVILLYSPVFIVSGFDQVASNSFVAPLDKSEYWRVLSERLLETWDVFRKGTPEPTIWILIVGFVVAPFFQNRDDQPRVSFAYILILFSAGFIFVRRVAPFDRMWLFVVPVFLIWAAAGIVGFYNFTLRRLVADRRWIAAGTKFGLLVIILTPIFLGGQKIFSKQISNGSPARNVTVDLENILETGDVVVTTFPVDALVRYYFDLYQLNDGDRFSDRGGSFRNVFVVIDESKQTFEGVLQKEKFPLEFLDLTSATLVSESSPLQVYQIDHK